MKTQTDTLKELLIANMPAYPVKRSYLVSIYGQGVVGALNDLMAENKVLRAKRGYYILSDEILDQFAGTCKEDSDEGLDDVREFMPTQVLRILISSWVSQFSIGVLLRNGLADVLDEVGYFTTSTVGGKDDQFQNLLEEFDTNLNTYRLTDDGVRLRNLMMAGV